MGAFKKNFLHGNYFFNKKIYNSYMATIVNWSRQEVYKLIRLWSDDVIQEQLEGCCRNSQVYKKIVDSLCEAGFNQNFEQCREKMKKLRGTRK